MRRATFTGIILIALLFIFGIEGFAQDAVKRSPFQGRGVPANPAPIEFTQPDGSKITIKLKGDAVVNWAETIDGHTLLKNKAGAYEYAILNSNGELVPSGRLATNRNAKNVATESKGLKFNPKQIEKKVANHMFFVNGNDGSKMGGFPTTGNRKLLMILVNFSNTSTNYTQGNFNNYMNQVNYNGTGSFKDYYLENSYGQLNVTTDVTQWVTVPNTHNYYGPESRWSQFIVDAIDAADAAGVDFSQYDGDGDGYVDGIAVIHQGVGQEESSSTNDIWSHNFNLRYGPGVVTKDGVKIDAYTCQPERSGSGMASIGVMCHEFGHNLGLPDFYDTNYGTGGQQDGTGKWDMMASGSYNNYGRTPAHHNPWSKIYLNWASATVLSDATTITNMPNSAKNAKFYRYNTTTSNEYFLLENRQKVGFDASLPGSGLLIFHADGSYINSHMSRNDINASAHQGFYPVSATTSINSSNCPFPTSSKTSFTDATSPNAKSWAGANTNKPIKEITENTSTKTVSFKFGETIEEFTLPFTENFNSSSFPTGWTQKNSNCTDRWTVSSTNKAGGTANEMKAKYENKNPATSRLVTPKINTTGTDKVEFSFKYMFDDYGAGANLKIQSTKDGINWTDESWTLASTSNKETVNTVKIEITNNLNSKNTQFAFVLTGNLYQIDYWYIDNLNIVSKTTPEEITYCTAIGESVKDEWIKSVVIGNLTNNSGNNGGYKDFSSISTTMALGQSYNVTLTPDHSGQAYNEYWRVWIDFNNDGDFRDSKELVFDAGQKSTTAVTGTLAIPSTVEAGTFRMRVAMRYNTAPGACVSFDYGEVEDYTVNIVAATGAMMAVKDNQIEEAQNVKIYPNPAKDELTVVLPQNTENAKVMLYDLTGKMIKNINVQAKQKLNISDLNSGVYMIVIENNGKVSTHKLIKQ